MTGVAITRCDPTHGSFARARECPPNQTPDVLFMLSLPTAVARLQWKTPSRFAGPERVVSPESMCRVRYNQAYCDGVKALRVFHAGGCATAVRAARKTDSGAEIVVAKAPQRSYREITSFHFNLLGFAPRFSVLSLQYCLASTVELIDVLHGQRVSTGSGDSMTSLHASISAPGGCPSRDGCVSSTVTIMTGGPGEAFSWVRVRRLQRPHRF